MSRRAALTFLLLLAHVTISWGGTLPHGYPETQRIKRCINVGWQYHLGDLDAAEAADHDDSGWETVSVPHTLKLTSLALDRCQDDKTQATFHRDIAWYRRTIEVSKKSSKVFLEFEGAHQVTDAWVNGQHVGQHAIGGYTPFHFDITSHVQPGTNIVALRLDNRRREDTPPDPGPFDYIKFSGLYRDVYLVETAPLHVTFAWEDFYAGVFVTTPTVDPLNGNATVSIRTTVRNEHAQSRSCKLVSRVIDKTGEVVLRLSTQATILPGADYTFNQAGGIEEDLHLWSCEDPYLYRVNTLVYDGDEAVDCIENPLGIRSIELNKHDGFLLNGKPVKMIGANRHQHYPYIGDAVPDALHFKDMWQFKQLGFNTVRTAHYPHDNALLDACDRLGILVYEEPPTWISIGNDAWFDNLEQAARRMVRTHRNHPSVVIWGAGINHRGYVPRLHCATKQEDPTRWTGSNNSEWTGWQTSGVCDLYTNMDYDGIRDWSGKEYLFAMEGGGGQNRVSRYKSDPLRIGLTSWTAHAYYTFHLGHERDNRMRSGMMDGFRTPSPGLHWYRAEITDAPLVVIRDAWQAGIKQLRVYSNCEEVELRVNGKRLARQGPISGPSTAHVKSPEFVFDIQHYEPGDLTAQGLIQGRIRASDRVRTPGKAAGLQLRLDMKDRELTADGADIVMAYARIVDENGTAIRDAKQAVRFTVRGPAEIVGDQSLPGANPIAPVRDGVAPALVRTKTEPGLIIVRAEAPGLKGAEASVTSVPFEGDMIARLAGPIYDLKKVRVDLGAPGQLVQFDWIPWQGQNNEPASLSLRGIDGRVILRTGSEDGITRWLGEMNVKGFHGFVMGEGVCVIDPKGLVLVFEGLPVGRYSLRTFHHAPRSNTNSMDPNRERLKALKIHEIPVAQTLSVRVADSRARVSVTSGKILPAKGPGTGLVHFEVSGSEPVLVRITDAQDAKGIWLNGFELQEAR